MPRTRAGIERELNSGATMKSGDDARHDGHEPEHLLLAELLQQHLAGAHVPMRVGMDDHSSAV